VNFDLKFSKTKPITPPKNILENIKMGLTELIAEYKTVLRNITKVSKKMFYINN